MVCLEIEHYISHNAMVSSANQQVDQQTYTEIFPVYPRCEQLIQEEGNVMKLWGKVDTQQLAFRDISMIFHDTIFVFVVYFERFVFV